MTGLHLPPYQLAQIYHTLRQAVAGGQPAQASRGLSQALGLDLPDRPPDFALARANARGLVPQLTYRGFKPAELAMLAADVKPVVKLEDIPLAAARRFVASHGGRYRITASEPYLKDCLLLRSHPAPPGHPSSLVCLYVSRGDQGAALHTLEAEHRENVEGCGRLLGFPACCIAAFAADFAVSRADQDAVNDDACRRVLVTAGPDRPGHPGCNPLSDLEMLGFYACTARCAAALALATRTAAALGQAHPEALAQARTQLCRPALFFRLPFFLVFDGSFQDGTLVYRDVQANVFPDPVVRRVQAWFAAHLLAVLGPGDRLRIGPSAVEVYAADRPIAQLPFDPRWPPLLTTWQSSPPQFF